MYSFVDLVKHGVLTRFGEIRRFRIDLFSWCFTSTETTMLIRDGRMEVGEEGGSLYIYYRYTVTTKMTPALRWAAVRVILMFH